MTAAELFAPPFSVCVDRLTARARAGGITVDWSTVPAAASDLVLEDGTAIKAGERYLRFGTVVLMIPATGMFGPASATASDGREIWTGRRGEAYIVHRTMLETMPASDHLAVIDGGTVHRDRLNIGGPGQPSIWQFLAMFPGVTFGP